MLPDPALYGDRLDFRTFGPASLSFDALTVLLFALILDPDAPEDLLDARTFYLLRLCASKLLFLVSETDLVF